LLSCLKFARLTKASVFVSFDGCDDECVLGFVLDSVSPRFTVFVGTSPAAPHSGITRPRGVALNPATMGLAGSQEARTLDGCGWQERTASAGFMPCEKPTFLRRRRWRCFRIEVEISRRVPEHSSVKVTRAQMKDVPVRRQHTRRCVQLCFELWVEHSIVFKDNAIRMIA
jgi:hypothetical protein